MTITPQSLTESPDPIDPVVIQYAIGLLLDNHFRGESPHVYAQFDGGMKLEWFWGVTGGVELFIYPDHLDILVDDCGESIGTDKPMVEIDNLPLSSPEIQKVLKFVEGKCPRRPQANEEDSLIPTRSRECNPEDEASW